MEIIRAPLKMAKFVGLDKLVRLWQIIKFNGGIRGTAWKRFRNDDVKIGTLVGEDKFGNKYYENKRYFYATNRWVDYSEEVYFDFDASQVPPEWHRWLHYMTDDPPSKVPPKQYPWMIDHTENFSGTDKAYVPYSTTRPKIESWIPPKSK